MSYLPVFLSIAGLFLGPWLAIKLNNCPHRGRVWGAFMLPLLALFYPPVQLFALATSLCAALAAGFTAHKPLKVSLFSVSISGLLVTLVLGRFF